jgi:PilZ domain
MAVADRRKAARSTVLDAALIRFGDVSVCCAVRDLSEGGAALNIGKQTGIPDQFTLIVPRGKIYSCTVIWRKGRRIGVSFI